LADLGKEQLDLVGMVFEQVLDLIVFSDKFLPSGTDRIE